jgi:uncharacterized phage protein gp47/JayE
MPYKPRSDQDIYESLRESLKSRITKLSNFTERSFNYVWTQAFANEVRELEVRNLVSQFSGWVDYAGRPITEEDLEQLGLAEDVSPEEIEEFTKEEYLDELVKIVGVRRFEGARASGTVTIDTQAAQTTIPKGTKLTTEVDTDGNSQDFLTTEEVETADGVTQVDDVPIQAEDVGAESNVPANTIIRFEEPPVGVKGVTNPSSTTGGEDRESNDELRTRAKNAVESSSQGGTTDGIKGYIRQNVEGVGAGDVIIDEFTDTKPPFVDVIVDGGVDTEVEDAIDFSRPTGIRHNLVRPQVIQVGFDTDLVGQQLDTTAVEDRLTDYLLNLGLGENVYQDKIVQQILDVDADIVNIDSIGGYVERVTNEQFEYDNTITGYRLDFTYDDTHGSVTVQDKSGETYTQGTDFELQDQTGDGWPETVVWLNNTTPNDGEDFFVDYDVTNPGQTAFVDYYDLSLVRDETFNWNPGYSDSEDYENTQDIYQLDFVPFPSSLSISDASGDTYTEGTDFDLIDDTGNGFKQSVDWSIGGSSPDDNEVFTATYDQKVYLTQYDITQLPDDEIRESDGNLLTEGTDFELGSYKQNNTEFDAINFLQHPTELSNGEEFYVTYISQGDKDIGDREKADAGQITVTEV